jgi:hypothetical protein
MQKPRSYAPIAVSAIAPPLRPTLRLRFVAPSSRLRGTLLAPTRWFASFVSKPISVHLRSSAVHNTFLFELRTANFDQYDDLGKGKEGVMVGVMALRRATGEVGGPGPPVFFERGGG